MLYFFIFQVAEPKTIQGCEENDGDFIILSLLNSNRLSSSGFLLKNSNFDYVPPQASAMSDSEREDKFPPFTWIRCCV